MDYSTAVLPAYQQNPYCSNVNNVSVKPKEQSIFSFKNTAIVGASAAAGFLGHKAQIFGTPIEAGIASLVAIVAGLYMAN